MSCFCVTNPFPTTFCYVEKQNGILRKNREEGLEKSYVPLHGGFYYVEKQNGILCKNREERFEKFYVGAGGGQKLPKSSLHN